MRQLKQMLKDSLAQEGLALAAAGAALLCYSLWGQLTGKMGSWGASPYLFPAGAATLLLALGLRLLWSAVRHPRFMQQGSYDPVVEDLAAEDYDAQEAELLREVSLENDDPPPTQDKEGADSPAPQAGQEGKRVLLALALTVLYCVAMPYVGFLLATACYLFVLLLALGEQNRLVSLAVAVVTAATVYLIFGVALGVMLP
ncbi:MAG: tripartite tricarboxylate transporter TctB family protein [Angelakisella sp.]